MHVAREANPALRHCDVVTDHMSTLLSDEILILLVDDDESIRDIYGAILKYMGYRVLTAANGAEGVALFEKHIAEIALVITDRDMPVLDGAAFARIIRSLNPTVKILAISGALSFARTRDPQSERYVDAFLAKPASARALLDSVAQLLPVTSTLN